MNTLRIFFVNDSPRFAGSNLWSEELLRQKLGYGKWEVFWGNYADEHPELADVHRLEGVLTTDEIFSLIDHFNNHVGVLHLRQGPDPTAMCGFDTNYWISTTQLCVSNETNHGIDELGYLRQLSDRTNKFKCGLLFRSMRLFEAFELGFFEELICEPFTSEMEKFLIHKEDIEPNGKFHKFRQYTIGKFSEELGVMIMCH